MFQTQSHPLKNLSLLAQKMLYQHVVCVCVCAYTWTCVSEALFQFKVTTCQVISVRCYDSPSVEVFSHCAGPVAGLLLFYPK